LGLFAVGGRLSLCAIFGKSFLACSAEISVDEFEN